MSWLPVIAVIYGGGLIFALVQTYFEGWLADASWDVHRIAGLLACTIWPVLVIGLAVYFLFMRISRRFAREA